MVSRPAWVIMDAADTLLRPQPDVASVYERIGREYGGSVTAANIQRAFTPALRRHFGDHAASEPLDRQRCQSLVFDVLQSCNDQMFRSLWEHFAQPQHWRLFDDVQPAWSWLRHNGFNLAIASNFDGRLRKILAGFPELDPDHVFISSELGCRKPSGSFFRAIEYELKVEARRILLVGDNLAADFRGARAAGWQALLIDRTLQVDTDSMICRLTSLRRLLA